MDHPLIVQVPDPLFAIYRKHKHLPESFFSHENLMQDIYYFIDGKLLELVMQVNDLQCYINKTPDALDFFISKEVSAALNIKVDCCFDLDHSS